MRVIVEILRNIQEAAKVIEQLPHANGAIAVPLAESVILTPSQLVEQLHEELKGERRIDIVLTPPRPEFFEMQKILNDKGFNMVPVVYRVGREEISYALLDAGVRPPYNQGLQMYEEDIRKDGQNGPLAEILVRGRDIGRIAVPSSVSHVPCNSRFAVSCDEIDGFVAPEVAKVSPCLAKQIDVSGTKLRVQNGDEFKQAGVLDRFAHLGQSHTRVWLYNDSGDGGRLFGSRLFSGLSGFGGVRVFPGWRSDYHLDSVAFSLQAIMPPQKIG